jgi:hypothetical protein
VKREAGGQEKEEFGELSVTNKLMVLLATATEYTDGPWSCATDGVPRRDA